MNVRRCGWSAIGWLVLAGLCGLVAANAGAQTVVVDNEDPEFSILYGTWDTGTYDPPWGTNYNWALTTGVGENPAAAEWRPNLPHAGAYHVYTWYVQGTNRAVDAPYTINHVGGSTTVEINQQVNGGTWVSLGTFSFNAGSGGSVELDNDAGASVVIADAVQFVAETTTVELTMVANPGSWGTTVPAPGGPYTYYVNEVVPITATAYPGYEFSHWIVANGLPVANPTSPSTTVTMDQNKWVSAVFIEEQPVQPEFRAFWADAFHSGFKSTSQIDDMIARAVEGNYNAIIPEVLAYHDTGSGGHGAYWDSNIVPMASDIIDLSDPLAYLVQQAHANGLEVHCWLVAFRVSSTWPPAGNPTVSAHPEWLMVPSGSMGSVAKVGSYYTFDAGSPGTQDYLMSIVRELCENYEIDGIHWDYIRYTQTDAGYPTSTSEPTSSLARFKTITGYSGTPPATGNTSWDNFRRRTISEVVRRTMAEVATIESPRQPLRHTAAVVTWYPANTDFHQTNPYKLFSDWEYWQDEGYLDATVPMSYFDENSYPSTYRAWVDNSVYWANLYNRHTYIGPGIYMNTFADSLTQMAYARSVGAHGFSTYSYQATNDGGEPSSDWYPYIAANLFDEPAPVPSMNWRDPATATEGNIYGRVTDGSTGAPIDDAIISVNGGYWTETDGSGFFMVTRRAAGASGTPVALSASFAGYADATRPLVLVERAGFTEANLALGSWLPGDYDVDADVDLDDFDKLLPAITGPDLGPPPAGGDIFDINDDSDVDLSDFAVFQDAFTG
ncbi:MAG: family 10 glycosylhydrolase [Phycisphaerae bacterium]|nr:family 10 glycosylhydrolase [Phycisphaerae bacterium]